MYVCVCAWLCLSMSVSAVTSCQVCYVNDGLIFSLHLARTHVSCSHANLDMSNTYATHAHSPHLLLAVCIPSQSDFQEPVRKLFEGNSTWSILKAIRKSHHFQDFNIWWFLARKCSDAWQSQRPIALSNACMSLGTKSVMILSSEFHCHLGCIMDVSEAENPCPAQWRIPPGPANDASCGTALFCYSDVFFTFLV